MSSVFRKIKAPTDYEDLQIEFENEDPSIKYVAQSIISKSAVRRSDLSDQTSTIFDSGRDAVTQNIAIVWLRNGTDGEVYDCNVVVQMTTGQRFTKYFELTIKNIF